MLVILPDLIVSSPYPPVADPIYTQQQPGKGSASAIFFPRHNNSSLINIQNSSKLERVLICTNASPTSLT